MNYKNYILLFILFIFIQNKEVIKFISKLKGSVTSTGELTNYGIIIQGTFLVLSFMVLELLIHRNIL